MSDDPTLRVSISDQDKYVLGRVLEMLGSGHALSQDLEDYVVGFGVLGRLASVATGEYELAEQTRKVAWSNAFITAKNQVGQKVTDRMAEVVADLEIAELRSIEIQKKEKASRLRATQDTVREAIWAIKSLNKMGG